MKRILYLALAIITGVLLSACSTNAGTVAQEQEVKQAEKAIVYISGPEAMINQLEEAFEAERGDVLDMVKMSCGQLRSKTWTEHEAGRIQADVIWGSDPLIYNKLDQENAFEKVEITDLDQVRSEYLLEDKTYTYINERYVGVLYNKETVLEVPKSFEDLNNPVYKNSIVAADATQSSTAFAITASLAQVMDGGMTYFDKLNDNGLLLSKSNGQVPSKILEGQAGVGIGPIDAVIRLENKGKKEGYEVPLAISWPSEGVVSLIRPIALVKNDERNKSVDESARAFINFMHTKQAQKITTKFGFVSIRKDIENNILPKDVLVQKIDWEMATENEEAIQSAYRQVFNQ